jgi:hypothetical protein
MPSHFQFQAAWSLTGERALCEEPFAVRRVTSPFAEALPDYEGWRL